jgi:TonB family protein
LIHFDFDQRYSDELIVGNALSRREGVMLSVIVHLVILLVFQFLPDLPMFQPSPEEIEARQQAQLTQQEQEEAARRFVFVQPRVELESPEPPPRADLSDLDRRAQAPQRAREPVSQLPFSLGNSPERVDAPPEQRPEQQRGPRTPVEPDTEPPEPEPEEQLAHALPPADRGFSRSSDTSRPAPGALGEALRNLERYVQNETFHNDRGGVDEPGTAIQFDTRGVEFGPWLRRFVAQVRRNWFVPYAAMTFRGRVVLQFNIHKDGRITDITVASPSDINAFNLSANNAILGSNPTEPLPPEYPDPMAFFTVTFYYNENPPLR